MFKRIVARGREDDLVAACGLGEAMPGAVASVRRLRAKDTAGAAEGVRDGQKLSSFEEMSSERSLDESSDEVP